MTIRLSNYDLKAISSLFRKFFLPQDGLWIFGSRVDIKRKGGDIDLYIETNANTIDVALKMKFDFISALEDKLGEQQIDIVINNLNFPHRLPIHEVAKTTGIKIA